MYGYEAWPLSLREENRLRVFENRVLRKIFGAKRDKVTGEWRGLHYEELSALYSSPIIMQVIRSRIIRQADSMQHVWGQVRCVHDFDEETQGKETA
jgi:hypothetical protein